MLEFDFCLLPLVEPYKKKPTKKPDTESEIIEAEEKELEAMLEMAKKDPAK